MGVLGNNIRLGSSAASDYEIEKSLRFNRQDSTYLNRTPGTSTYKKGTYSFWVKKATDGKINSIIQSGRDGSGNNQSQVAFWSDDKLQVMSYSSSSYQLELKTTAQYRDIASWYHVVIAWDTTQATNTNRAKIYINGEQITDFTTATYPSQNDLMMFDNPNASASGVNRIGPYWTTGYYADHSFDGYLSDLHYVDGTQLTASDFGKTNPVTGAWIPVEYLGTHGTNGYHLLFDDNSGTTATTLGKDSSGNGNNWTPNNFSVAAGAGNDSVVDTPTNNYPTLNSLHWCALYGGGGTSNGPDYTQGNLRFVGPSSATSPWERATAGTMVVNSGAWYFEVTIENFSNGNGIGVVEANSQDSNGGWPGAARWTWNCFDEQRMIAGTNTTNYGTKPSNGDIVGCAVDIDNNTIDWFVNNTSQGQTTNIGISGKSILIGAIIATFAAERYTINFGQQGFAYTPPTGFKALCTANLPDPTIKKSNKHFKVNLWTGTGSDKSIDVGFQPDLVWIKNRSHSGNWYDIYDSVRGVTKRVHSNRSEAEGTQSEGLKTFNSDGYTVGNNSDVGASGNHYVGWSWKAGGSPSSNSDGTITSSVSVNASAGFSIATYTGTGASATVGHGLGVAPEMVFIKRRDSAGDWIIGHDGYATNAFANNKFLKLHTSDGLFTNSLVWGSQPTSTVVQITTGNAGNLNASGGTYVMYSFASVEGFSKIGKYTGNNSSNGPFLVTGFRPAWVMIKNIASGESWEVYDSGRDPDNVITLRLQADTDGAEVASTFMDFVSNGIKMRNTSGGYNNNGGTFTYIAFAESPIKYSNTR